jgi:hypothetical protein
MAILGRAAKNSLRGTTTTTITTSMPKSNIVGIFNPILHIMWLDNQSLTFTYYSTQQNYILVKNLNG